MGLSAQPTGKRAMRAESLGRPSIRVWEWGLVALLAVGAALLRWRQIGAQGMWLDEAFSVWMARRPPAEQVGWIVSIDQHPPLYYLLLGGWMRLVGDAESSVRGLSALLSAASIPAIYVFARRLLGVAPAIAAALLLMVSPFHVRFAQEARMYALLTFNAAWALAALAYLLTGDWRRGWWGAYSVFSALTLLSHNTAIFFLGAVNLAVACAAVARHRGDPSLTLPSARAWLTAQGAVLLLWAPWLPSFVRQSRAVDSEFWIQPPTTATIVETLRTFVSYYGPRDAAWIWGAAALALLLGIIALRRNLSLMALLVVLVAAPFVGELLVSLRRPIFYDRTLIWTTLPLFTLMAAGVGRLRSAALPSLAAIGALLIANGLSLQGYYRTFTKEQWREAAAYVAQRAGADDLLLFNATWVQIPFEYYFDRYGLAVEKRGAPVDLFDAGVLEPKMTEADIPALQTTVAEAACVWLIYSHDWYTDPDRIVPRVLRRELMSLDTTTFVGLEVQLYQRRGGTPCGELRTP